jgi:hypothetical protein
MFQARQQIIAMLRRSSKLSTKRTWGSVYVAKQEAVVCVFMFLLRLRDHADVQRL